MAKPEKKGKKRGAQEEEGEAAFVRGGGSGLAAIEKKRLEQVRGLLHMLAGACSCPVPSRMLPSVPPAVNNAALAPSPPSPVAPLRPPSL